MPGESDTGFLSSSEKMEIATADAGESKRRKYSAGLYTVVRNCLPVQDRDAIFAKIEQLFRKNYSSMHSAVVSSVGSIINEGREQALETLRGSVIALT
jgi:hypothetical protein